LKVAGLTNLEADLVIVRGVFNSLKTIAAVVAGLRKKKVKVFDNGFLAHRYSIDKITDMVKLTLAGLPVPRSAYSRDFQDYSQLAEKLGYPLVVKSTRMGKGVSVFRFETPEELASFINQCQTEDRPAKGFLLQEFIPYLYDLRVLIVGKHLFTMRRLPAPGEFRANFSLGGKVEPFELDRQGQKLAWRALKAIGLSVGGVDMLMTKKKRYLLEVNHTAGFVGMEKAVGENIGKLFIEHAIKNSS